jgi:ribosome-associated protein
VQKGFSMSDGDEADGPTRRQLAKQTRRIAGDRSASLARTLMSVKPSVLGKLGLDERIATVIDRARAITSQIARRRAERTVAGELRGVDLVALAARLATVQETGDPEPELLHLVEHWRERLIADSAAAAELPSGNTPELARLIERARSERATGKPPGAGRALFRELRELLAAPGT